MSIGPAVEAEPVIWTARLRTGRVVILRASGSRAFRAAASIALVAADGDLAAVIALVWRIRWSAVIASVAAGDLAAAALAGLAGRRWRISRRRRIQGPTLKINAWRVLSYFL